MENLNDQKLKNILPDSIKKDSEINAISEAIDPLLNSVSKTTDAPLIYKYLDKLNGEHLDHLATIWDASVWRQNWPLEIKRNVIKTIISDKRIKGTLAAVKSAIQTIGNVSEIKEWFEMEPPGEPHTFRVTANISKFAGVLDSDLQKDLRALIDDAKPARSHYDFILSTYLQTQIKFIPFSRRLTYARVKSSKVSSVETAAKVGVFIGGKNLTLRQIVATAK